MPAACLQNGDRVLLFVRRNGCMEVGRVKVRRVVGFDRGFDGLGLNGRFEFRGRDLTGA